jgi:hypothetical protein
LAHLLHQLVVAVAHLLLLVEQQDQEVQVAVVVTILIHQGAQELQGKAMLAEEVLDKLQGAVAVEQVALVQMQRQVMAVRVV